MQSGVEAEPVLPKQGPPETESMGRGPEAPPPPQTLGSSLVKELAGPPSIHRHKPTPLERALCSSTQKRAPHGEQTLHTGIRASQAQSQGNHPPLAPERAQAIGRLTPERASKFKSNEDRAGTCPPRVHLDSTYRAVEEIEACPMQGGTICSFHMSVPVRPLSDSTRSR